MISHNPIFRETKCLSFDLQYVLDVRGAIEISLDWISLTSGSNSIHYYIQTGILVDVLVENQQKQSST